MSIAAYRLPLPLPPLSGLPDPVGLQCAYPAHVYCEMIRESDGAVFQCEFDPQWRYAHQGAIPWCLSVARSSDSDGCIIAHVGSLDAAKLFASVYRFPPP